LLFHYLNSAIIILVINIALGRTIGISIEEYKKNPGESLILGLLLIPIGSFLRLILQEQLSGLAPPTLFLCLLVLYYFMTTAKWGKKKRRRR
jgi:hypothetical protein